jgi:hypothetical protein
LEELGLIGLGDAGAGVAHRDAERPVCDSCLYQHLAAIGKLDGISDQVEQDLPQPVLVAVADRQTGRHLGLESELLLSRQWLDRNVDGIHYVPERVIGKRERELPRLYLGQIEHIVDQAEQMFAVAFDALEHAAHLFRRVAINVIEDELGVAENGIERRAQLVAHIGEKLRLVLAGQFQLLIKRAQLLAHPVDIGRQDAQLIAVGDVNAPRECAGSNLA